MLNNVDDVDNDDDDDEEEEKEQKKSVPGNDNIQHGQTSETSILIDQS